MPASSKDTNYLTLVSAPEADTKAGMEAGSQPAKSQH